MLDLQLQGKLPIEPAVTISAIPAMSKKQAKKAAKAAAASAVPSVSVHASSSQTPFPAGGSMYPAYAAPPPYPPPPFPPYQQSYPAHNQFPGFPPPYQPQPFPP